MIKKKIKLYYKKSVIKIFSNIYGKVIFTKNTNKLSDLIKIKDVNLKTYDNKNYNIYITKKARIYTDNTENVAVIKNNKILPKMSFQQVRGTLRQAKFNAVLNKGTPSFITNFSGTVFNLAQGGSGNNYFHFFFDIIPKIYFIKKTKIFKKINFFYVSSPSEWQKKIFKILEIPKKKLIDSFKDNHIFADEIVSVDHPWYQKGNIQNQVKKLPKWIIFINRKLFLKKAKKFKCKKRIFLDRTSSLYNHCQIHNFKEFKNWVYDKNLKFYSPEKLSLENQIYLFKNASIILGAHGAAFTNIIFCKPGTKIIEIIPSDHPNKKCERICKILNLKYFRISTKPDNSDKNFPYKIHLEIKHFKMIDRIINL